MASSFIYAYIFALIKIATSYLTLIVVTLLVTAFLYIPVIIGTNTGEDGCVYTSAANKTAYVKKGEEFVEYERATHGDDAKTLCPER